MYYQLYSNNEGHLQIFPLFKTVQEQLKMFYFFGLDIYNK